MLAMAGKKKVAVPTDGRQVSFRMSNEDAERLARAARAENAFGTVSEFIRLAVMKEIERVEKKQEK